MDEHSRDRTELKDANTHEIGETMERTDGRSALGRVGRLSDRCSPWWPSSLGIATRAASPTRLEHGEREENMEMASNM